MSTTILFNPRCSTCRKGLDLLEQHDITPDIIEYLKEPPTVEELKEILTQLGLQAKDIIRTKEAEYTELNLAAITDEDELIQLMVRHPKLIQRPIVIHNGKAIIGRPPENILKIL